MDKLCWCLRQKRGISLVEPKLHLRDSYMRDAEESLQVCLGLEGKWKIISGYYACYNALYSILMRGGIKSEIHDCSIELMSVFDFSDEDVRFLKKLKEDRIQTQYYLREVCFDSVDKVRDFVSRCKEILEELSSFDVEGVRRVLDEK